MRHALFLLFLMAVTAAGTVLIMNAHNVRSPSSEHSHTTPVRDQQDVQSAWNWFWSLDDQVTKEDGLEISRRLLTPEQPESQALPDQIYISPWGQTLQQQYIQLPSMPGSAAGFASLDLPSDLTPSSWVFMGVAELAEPALFDQQVTMRRLLVKGTEEPVSNEVNVHIPGIVTVKKDKDTGKSDVSVGRRLLQGPPDGLPPLPPLPPAPDNVNVWIPGVVSVKKNKDTGKTDVSVGPFGAIFKSQRDDIAGTNDIKVGGGLVTDVKTTPDAAAVAVGGLPVGSSHN